MDNLKIVKNELEITSAEIIQFMQDFSASRGWDPETIPQIQYNALCAAVGYNFFGPDTATLYKKNNKVEGLDPDKILYVYNIYINITNLYNKIPSITSFSMFICLDYYTILELINNSGAAAAAKSGTGANATYSHIVKSLTNYRENSLKDRAVDKGGAVGVAIVGNSEFAWNDPGRRQSFTTSAGSVALPDFTNPQKRLETI